jgi:hypothetical protein
MPTPTLRRKRRLIVGMRVRRVVESRLVASEMLRKVEMKRRKRGKERARQTSKLKS